MLICAKCLRKADDGRAIRKALKAGLAATAGGTGRRPGRLVETKCMGLCPKRAVTLASGATLLRGELLVLRRAGDAETALEALLGSFGCGSRPSPQDLVRHNESAISL